MHTGGIAGQAGATRDVPLSLFAAAPRLHQGGFIGADEVPAILRRGEGVFTPEQMAAMAPARGDRVEVRIVDQRSQGGPIETRERRGADGRRVIEAVIRDALPAVIGRGDVDRPLEARYGLRPQVR